MPDKVEQPSSAGNRPTVVLVHLGGRNDCPRAHRLQQLFARQLAVTRIHQASKPCAIAVRAYGIVGRIINAMLLLCGAYEFYLRRKYRLSGALPAADRVVCHDLLLLPLLCARYAPEQVVLDAREYYPRQFEQSLLWRLTSARLARYLCRQYLPALGGMVTVSASIADLYAREFGRKPQVAPSYPIAQPLTPQVPDEPLRMVHHGNATENRRLENMIEMMDRLGPGFELHLYLVPKPGGYHERLCAMAHDRPNVFVHDPIPFTDLVTTLNGYDVGLFVPPASTANLDMALPNKLFEFVQARLMVVVSPLAEASAFVRTHQLGRVTASAEPEDLAAALADLDVQTVLACKQQVDRSARELHAGVFAAVIARELGLDGEFAAISELE